jgi:2-amino-4-hydroxy-6-hydroxymethyldihydropteridine diphosphokinase
MARCLIGCGSNLGQRREQLDRALELLRFMPGVAVRAVSRYRETRPIGGPVGQSAFLNGACLIETDLPARDVLDMLAAVENTLHRERTDRWAARTIDLDLLLYDDLVVETSDLTVPHPRMATRRFVLEPAAEIAADLPYPPAACTVGDLLENIRTAHPRVAIVGVPGSGAREVAAAVADAVMARVIHASEPMPWSPGAAPAPLDRWRRTLAAWVTPIAGERSSDDHHGTIVDYWCGTLALAADEDLRGDDRAHFRAEVEAAAAATVPPTVAILLVADAATFADRLAFRARHAGSHSDVFADLPAAATPAADTATALVRLQERLERRLRCPADRCPRAPKAVVTVYAGDLARAAADATAAVEAML